MIEHVFTAEQWIDRPRAEVFPFFSAAGNLERITPPDMHFQILTPQPIAMDVGTLIDYRLRLGPIPFGWRTRITRWEPPFAFEDTQLRGPYRQWIHLHTFDEVDGRTLMRDTVRWVLPLSPLGDVAYPLIRRQIKGIFEHRGRVIEEVFGS